MTTNSLAGLLFSMVVAISLGSTCALAQNPESLLRETSWGMSSQQVRALEAERRTDAPTQERDVLHYRTTLLDYPAEVLYFFGGNDSLVAIEVHLSPMDSAAAALALDRLGSVLTASFGTILPGVSMTPGTARWLHYRYWRSIETEAMLGGTADPASRATATGTSVRLEFRSRKLARPLVPPCGWWVVDE